MLSLWLGYEIKIHTRLIYIKKKDSHKENDYNNLFFFFLTNHSLNLSLGKTVLYRWDNSANNDRGKALLSNSRIIWYRQLLFLVGLY